MHHGLHQELVRCRVTVNSDALALDTIGCIFDSFLYFRCHLKTGLLCGWTPCEWYSLEHDAGSFSASPVNTFPR